MTAGSLCVSVLSDKVRVDHSDPYIVHAHTCIRAQARDGLYWPCCFVVGAGRTVPVESRDDDAAHGSS